MQVTENIDLGKYQLLTIDGERPDHFTHYKIGGKVFRPVPAFGMPGCIAIEDNRSHIGETVEFIRIES